MKKQNCTSFNRGFAKTVIINRAVPGSGKTTISRCLTGVLAEAGAAVGNHSTDDFFMRDGRYCFDVRKLQEYHHRNQELFEADLKSGVDVVICDNTNLQPWQSAPYTDMARRYGYRVLFLNFLPRELWKHVQSQQITPEKPDAHQVPESVLQDFIRDFNDYNDLLDRTRQADPRRQLDFRWDENRLRPVATGRAAANFDNDAVFTIRPGEYTAAQTEIGGRVLEFMHR